MGKHVGDRIHQVYSILLNTPNLRPHIDTKHKIPATYSGDGQIKLIIIGQDPTVKNKASRKNITTVFNLDKPGKMQRYVSRICSLLDFDPMNEIYATNLLKNFFEEPLTNNKEIVAKFANHWLPVLKEEIELYKDVPVITLGDGLLHILLTSEQKSLVRNYWGYHEQWKKGMTVPFSHCSASENVLQRDIFPFPHQPSIVKDFYAARLDKYVKYLKEKTSVPELIAV